jgi:hypothetical protein
MRKTTNKTAPNQQKLTRARTRRTGKPPCSRRSLRPVAFALMELTGAEEAKIAALVKKAVS